MTEPFKPFIMYNEVGNILEIHWSDEAPIANWICPQLTLLRSSIDNRIIGVEIWGISFFERSGVEFNNVPLTEVEEKEITEALQKAGIHVKENASESELPGKVLPEQGKA